MATVLTLFMNLWRYIRMDAYTRTLRFNHNPLNLILGAEKKKGLRIGYMEAGLQGFYLNSMETGIHPQKLSKLLTEEFHCTDNESATGLFQFLINEGDRVSYQIMLPYLLSTENINEFENVIQKRFFGVERFIRQGKNLYKFVKYTEERRDPIIWINASCVRAIEETSITTPGGRGRSTIVEAEQRLHQPRQPGGGQLPEPQSQQR